MSRSFYWTKTWGEPDVPQHDALALRHSKTRNGILEYIQPGDIVVYLTSDAKEADKMLRGRLAGAVEIANPLTAVDVESLRPDNIKLPEHYNKEGRFRWPFGIAVSRCWKFIEQERNDTLIPNHAALKMQGGATIHKMAPEEIKQLMALDVREIVGGEKTSLLPFAGSLRRPWHQKAGRREGSNVQPGTELYIAQISDAHGLTFKVGSGKVEDRLQEMNRYRRGSMGEVLWSLRSSYKFDTVEAARAAEDHMLSVGKTAGHSSRDHNEFLIGISMRMLKQLYSEAIEVGLAADVKNKRA